MKFTRRRVEDLQEELKSNEKINDKDKIEYLNTIVDKIQIDDNIKKFINIVFVKQKHQMNLDKNKIKDLFENNNIKNISFSNDSNLQTLSKENEVSVINLAMINI